MTQKLKLIEIYSSIQGESTAAGRPCVLIRLSGCPMRCSYCDSSFAFEGGEEISIPSLMVRIAAFGIPLVELTGGEPLAQPSTPALVKELCDQGYEVLIETGGGVSIEGLDPRARIILDVKTPASGMQGRQKWDNLKLLRAHDEIKFVICSREDYEWSRDHVLQQKLSDHYVVLFSPMEPEAVDETIEKTEMLEKIGVTKQELAEWILEDRLKVRLNLQLHLWIWGRGVRRV